MGAKKMKNNIFLTVLMVSLFAVSSYGEFLIAGGAKNQDGALIAPCSDGFIAVWNAVDSNGYYRIHAGRIGFSGVLERVTGVVDGGGVSRLGVRQVLASIENDQYLLSWYAHAEWSAGAGQNLSRRSSLSWNGSDLITGSTLAGGTLGSGPFTTNGASWVYITRTFEGRGSGEFVRLYFNSPSASTVTRQVVGWGADIAHGSGYYLSVHRGSLEDASRLYAYRFDTTSLFTRLDSTLVYNSGGNILSDPKIAYGGGQFLLVYVEDEGNGRIRLKGRFLSGTTTLSIGSSFDIAPNAPDNREQIAPRIAYDSLAGNFIVVWQQGRPFMGDLETDIYSARVGGDGLIDSIPFVVCAATNSQELPRIVCKNGLSLVTWNDLRNGEDWDIYGRLLTQTSFTTGLEELVDVVSESILQASPNPFNPDVRISVKGWQKGMALDIVDVSGKVVASLTNRMEKGMEKSVTWKASGLSSGLYVAVLRNGGTTLRKKMMFLR